MMSVVANILDPIHETLPRNVWDNAGAPEPKLKAQHAKWIRTTVERALTDAGYTHVASWLSLVLTGSLTTYQYSELSDCDVSLFVDAEAFPEWSRAEMIGLMVKTCDGLKLPGTSYQMQFFVVAKGLSKDQLYQHGLRAGYDIDHHEWISPPDRDRVHDVEREMAAQYAQGLEAADKMERLLKFEPHMATIYWHQIHRRRMRDQKSGKGDFSDSNIIYKFLANRGLFPQISEVSGEFIAKTAAPWNRHKQVWEDKQIERLNNAIAQREGLWNHAFSQNKAPTDFLAMNGFGEYRPVPEDANWGGMDLSGEARYRNRMQEHNVTDGQWHQYYQKQMKDKFLNNSDATSGDYEDWWNWYTQHAHRFHWDPEGHMADLEVAPQEPKPWFAKTAWEQVDDGIWVADPGDETNGSTVVEVDNLTHHLEDGRILPSDMIDRNRVAKPIHRRVAKFVYDPINNHLVVGRTAAEEGEAESHYDIVHARNMDKLHGLRFGQVDQNGHVEVFSRPKIVGYGKEPMNQYEADWRLEQALKSGVPGAKMASGHDLVNPNWEANWTPPQVEFLYDRPIINATDQPAPQENVWDFESPQAPVLRS